MAAPRRNADGSLDIDYHRRRARRLRYLARRQAWAALRRVVLGAAAGCVRVARQEGAVPS